MEDNDQREGRDPLEPDSTSTDQPQQQTNLFSRRTVLRLNVAAVVGLVLGRLGLRSAPAQTPRPLSSPTPQPLSSPDQSSTLAQGTVMTVPSSYAAAIINSKFAGDPRYQALQSYFTEQGMNFIAERARRWRPTSARSAATAHYSRPC